MTAPWDGRAVSAILGDLRHVTYVYLVPSPGADPVPVDMVSGTLTFDELWSPYVQASVQARVPDDQATLDLFDARKRPRLQFFAGYVYPDGVEDVHLAASLILTDRNVRRPDNTMDLTATSDEVVLDLPSLTSFSWEGSASATLAARDVIAYHDPTGTIDVQVSPFAGALMPGAGAGELVQVAAYSDNAWSAVADFATRVDGWFYHDGLSTWVLRKRNALGDNVNAGSFSVGERGTITGSEAVLSTQDFANVAAVRYRWSGGETPWRVAQVTTGPLAVSQIGRHPVAHEFAQRGNAAAADRSAQTILSRAMTRGRELSFELAHAPYWARPNMRAFVRLPTGPVEPVVISRVDFQLGPGTARVRTRQPDNGQITTGAA
ncbi:hypothetical protein [Cellulosimicrobium sp. 22601]|uniref:hypothetical protein n=1 Tax=unclassified Cellulosimicrobium TaxID=2624466 RepID=UPI003F86DBDD